MTTDGLWLVPMDSGIYIIRTGNGRVYIGSSNNLIRRKREHFSALNRSIHQCSALQKAFNKQNGAEFTIIEYCMKEILIEREQHWFDLAHKIWIKKIYNINPIAGKPTHSEETRQRMAVAARNRKPISEETRKRISAASKGRKRVFTEEHKNKIKIARANQIMKSISDEHKQAIVLHNKKRKGVKVASEQALANLREGAKKRSATARLRREPKGFFS